jgi:hypothetical protein
MILYPDGYGTAKLSLDQMKLKHGIKMHPEFAKRFFAYIESKGGAIGVGGGWRSTQPDKPGFAPAGKSFHQDQRFASGRIAYAAVDLVHVNPGKVHRSPTWAECADAPTYGLHTFITGEPWHIQCIEMRGWQTWVNAGRPDPQPFTLPGAQPDPPEDDDMTYLFRLASGDFGLRGPSGSRRVSVEEFGETVPPSDVARPVAAGSNEEYWIGRELAAYDRALGI